MINTYYLYILKCSDETLYTGITTDIARRLTEHNSGNGAKYTACRKPVTLVYKREMVGRSAASSEEARIKKLSRAEKITLIESIQLVL